MNFFWLGCGVWEQGTRLCTVSLAKVPTVECKIQCTLSIPAVYMYLTCDGVRIFPPHIHAQTPLCNKKLEWKSRFLADAEGLAKVSVYTK